MRSTMPRTPLLSREIWPDGPIAPDKDPTNCDQLEKALDCDFAVFPAISRRARNSAILGDNCSGLRHIGEQKNKPGSRVSPEIGAKQKS